MVRIKNEVLQDLYGTIDHEKVSEMIRNEFSVIYHGPKAVDEWVKLKIPYKAPFQPGIPSLEEIGIAMQTHSLKHPSGCYPEAENLLYLEQHTKVRAPRLYAAFQEYYEGGMENFMVMEYVEGDFMTMEKFQAMDERDQEIITSKFSEQLQLLRSVEPPENGYYGRIYRQGWNPHFNFLSHRFAHLSGPYDTYDDFLSAMYNASEHYFATRSWTSDFSNEEVKFLADIKRVLGNGKGSRPVLTHLDLKWDNILVRPVKSADGNTIEDWQLTFIDWDTLGWAPAYLQNVSLWQRLDLYGKPQERVLEGMQGFLNKVWAFGEEQYDAEYDI
ncbi:hypothetical protein N0V90_008942 [Kalmusia sp. IMI 367209]|nr:hypothetical protein N0V90_008942 [Kalmusia sp. IMI 367209]